MPVGVPGRGHRDRPTGQVQRALGREGPRVRDGDRPGAAEPHGVQRPRQHARAPGVGQHLHRRDLLQVLTAGVRHLHRAAVRRGAVPGMQRDGRTDVVGVRVGDQQRSQVTGLVAQQPDGGLDVGRVARVAGVDQREVLSVAEQVPVDDAPVDAEHVVGDLLDVAALHPVSLAQEHERPRTHQECGAVALSQPDVRPKGLEPLTF